MTTTRAPTIPLPLYSSPVLTSDGRRLPSKGAAVCKWIQANVRLGPGDFYGQRFRLTTYQKRWIYRLFEFYPETGLYRYKRALFGTAKGNGKTPFEGALGAEGLAGPTAPVTPLVLVAAAALEQSNLVFGDLKAGITHDRSPLKPFILAYDLSIQLRDDPGEIKRVAAAQGTNDGPRATRFLADELHEWRGRLKETFTILDGAIGKRRNAFTVGISTAGSDRTSLLGEQYGRGVAVARGEIVDDNTLFEWYEIPDHVEIPDRIDTEADLEQWREAIWWANPALSEPGAKFLTEDYVRSRFDGAQQIPRYSWLRYHGNRWTRAESQWLPAGSWEARADAGPHADPIVLAFSGTYNGDSAGLVAISADGHVRTIDAWEPPEGPAGDEYLVPRGAVDKAVAEAMARWPIRRLVVNPNGWHGESQTWAERYGALDNKGRGAVVEFDWQHQTKRKIDACSSLFTAVVTGALTHDADPRLERHLENAETVEQKEGAYIARGGREGAAIDLAVAAVIGWDQAAAVPVPPKRGGMASV